MRITVITGLTPTPENRKGISALLYSLICYRPSDVEVKIYSYNLNTISDDEILQISRQLNAEIKVIKMPKWFNLFRRSSWLTRFNKFCMKRPIECYVFPNKKVLNEIRQDNGDFVLLYPYFMHRLTEKLQDKRFVILSPDSLSLHMARRFRSPFRINRTKFLIDDSINLVKYKNMEKEWGGNGINILFVGMEDLKFYSILSGNNNSHFLLHPYTRYKDKIINLKNEKLKVLIAGSYDIYSNTDVDLMLPSLIKHKKALLERFSFTFLGKKWESIKEKLNDGGFACEVKTWVDDYIEEIVKYDIQLTPVCYGTGTKGKTLDGLVNGLLVIGSKYAFENICVRDMDSCVLYRNAKDVADILISISQHRERYQAIAEKGREQIKKYHSPERISNRFFNIYGN